MRMKSKKSDWLAVITRRKDADWIQKTISGLGFAIFDYATYAMEDNTVIYSFHGPEQKITKLSVKLTLGLASLLPSERPKIIQIDREGIIPPRLV